MSAPNGITLDDLELINASQCVLYSGSTPFGQVAGIKLDQKVDTKSVFRIGDNTASTSRKPTVSTGGFDLYWKTSPSDLATLIGGDVTTGVYLDSALPAQDLTIQVWSGNDVAASQLGLVTITGYVPSGFSLPIDPDTDAKAAITFGCDNIVYTDV